MLLMGHALRELYETGPESSCRQQYFKHKGLCGFLGTFNNYLASRLIPQVAHYLVFIRYINPKNS